MPMQETAYPAFMETWLKMKLQQLEQKWMTWGEFRLRDSSCTTFLHVSEVNLSWSSWPSKGLIANLSLREEPALLSVNVF